ncbi:DUF3397 domain-containing protein [Virgibacillus flavescens]|uniref:DUF3397 domain-containing protein n=1 Tax=Virgibacillus flavescens TaxID=1611422 RepID=UPI003D32DA57
MWSIITYGVAGALTFPIVITWIIYKINRMLKKSRIYAFHHSIKWTTILYILSVMVLCNTIFHHFFIGYILAFQLVQLTIILIFQRINYTEVNVGKAWKIAWRASFLLYFSLYISLVLYGIFQQLLLI